MNEYFVNHTNNNRRKKKQRERKISTAKRGLVDRDVVM
jgi:hypothetical protein